MAVLSLRPLTEFCENKIIQLSVPLQKCKQGVQPRGSILARRMANFADPTCQFWLVFAGSRKIFTVPNFQKSKNYSKTKVYQIKLKKEVQIDIKQC